ncbi:MAG: hypothetical protein IPF56_23900 [Chloroflexi bacterium]|nr:hypothetical protein [Chloroflexota bacterium]
MKKVTVNWDELSKPSAMAGWVRYFLDTDTGQVLMMAEDQRYLQELYEEVQEEEASATFDLELALAESGLPDWQQEGVRTAISSGNPFRRAHCYHSRSLEHPRWLRCDASVHRPRRKQAIAKPAFQATRQMAHFVAPATSSASILWPAALVRLRENRLRQPVAAWLAEEDVEPINEPGGTRR